MQRLEAEPEAGGAKALLTFWEASLDAGYCSRLCGTATIALQSAFGAASPALRSLLQRRPGMPTEALRSALHAAGRLLDPVELLQIAQAALQDGSVVGAQREVWHLTALGIDPVHHWTSFVAEFDLDTVVGRFREEFAQGLVANTRALDLGARIEREALAVRLFAASRSSKGSRSPINDPCQRAITWLGQCPDPRSDAVLARLVAEQGAGAWRSDLRHALAIKTRARLDREFQHPSVEAIRSGLAGGSPVNAADLMAVVVDQLQHLRDESMVDDTMPWKAYWNLDRNGQPTEPRIENACRNQLLARLKDRLGSFGVTALPEAQRANETRADALVFGAAGANVPIEIKRHFHSAVWEAASTQLQGYAVDRGAAGYGIYLVFWFGTAWKSTPRRADGRRPTNAQDMESMLEADLSPAIRSLTRILVFDVSNPSAAKPAK